MLTARILNCDTAANKYILQVNAWHWNVFGIIYNLVSDVPGEHFPTRVLTEQPAQMIKYLQESIDGVLVSSYSLRSTGRYIIGVSQASTVHYLSWWEKTVRKSVPEEL